MQENNGSNRRLRLGMIGGGPGAFIGPIHRIAARLDDQFELVAGAFSSDPARSREAGAALYLDPSRVYGDWRQMITAESARAAGKLDAVAIVTPNHLHHAPTKACLENGFHVICDKPLAASFAEGADLEATVRATNNLFGLTHTYVGYPMVRQARAMIAAGELGALRLIQVEYAQEWLTQPLERENNKQAAWRVDPAQAGQGGALGDIGTHAYHLAGFVTGQLAQSLCADLSSFGAGRVLDDNAHVLLRYPGQVRGMLWASQVAPGSSNGLRLRVYGDKAGLSWSQEQPNQLHFAPFGEPARILERGGAPSGVKIAYKTRTPAGHPEGFLEAFAQLYTDFAGQIRSRLQGRDPDPACLLLPGVADGLEGMRFIAGAVRSSREGGLWLSRDVWAQPDSAAGGNPTIAAT